MFEIVDREPENAIIKVIGVGGGGGNFLARRNGEIETQAAVILQQTLIDRPGLGYHGDIARRLLFPAAQGTADTMVAVIEAAAVAATDRDAGPADHDA